MVYSILLPATCSCCHPAICLTMLEHYLNQPLACSLTMSLPDPFAYLLTIANSSLNLTTLLPAALYLTCLLVIDLACLTLLCVQPVEVIPTASACQVPAICHLPACLVLAACDLPVTEYLLTIFQPTVPAALHHDPACIQVCTTSHL